MKITLKRFKTRKQETAKNFRSPHGLLASRRGQAVTEYLLVLVVVVGIALGVLYQLNTAFKKYVQSYFGDYIACLLETGELPSLGGEEGVSGDVCNASFEPFSLKNGRPLIAGDSGDGGAGAGGRNRGKTSSSSSSSRARDPNAGSKVTRNRGTRNADRTTGTGSATASLDKNGKKKELKKASSSSSRFSFRARRMIRDGQIPLSGRFNMSSEAEKQKERPMTIKKLDAKDPIRRVTRKLALNPEQFKPKPQRSDGNIELGFGQWLRYILIIAILVAIVVFFGGQLNQLRKSWEKN